MKLPQFSLATILLAVTAVAIWCGSLLWFSSRIAYPRANHSLRALSGVVEDVVAESPAWLPVAFAAYTVGRKRLSGWMVVAFAVAQIGALVASQVTLFFTRGY